MIKPLELKHIPEIAKIHIQALKQDFLPSLGVDFLEVMYSGVFKKREAFGFVAQERGIVVGFVVGTKNMDKFFKTALTANFLKLAYVMAIKLLNRPALIKKTLETFLYTKKEKGPKPELVVIAVLDKWQGKGIGKKLVKYLETFFKKIKISKYKVTVYADRKAIKFYGRLNYSKLAEFNLYGKPWHIYEKSIN